MKRSIEQQEDSNKKIKTEDSTTITASEYNGPSAIKTIAATAEFKKLRKYKNFLVDFFGCIHHVDGVDANMVDCKEYPHLEDFSKTCERVGQLVQIIDSLAKELNENDLDWDIGFFSAILNLVARVYAVLRDNETRISESAKEFFKSLHDAYLCIGIMREKDEKDEGLSKLDVIKRDLLTQLGGDVGKIENSGWDIHNIVIKEMPDVQKAMIAIKENASFLCQEFLKLVEVPMVVDFVTQDGDLEFDEIKLDENGYYEYDEAVELNIQDVYEALDASVDDMYKYCDTHRYLMDSKNPYDVEIPLTK